LSRSMVDFTVPSWVPCICNGLEQIKQWWLVRTLLVCQKPTCCYCYGRYRINWIIRVLLLHSLCVQLPLARLILFARLMSEWIQRKIMGKWCRVFYMHVVFASKPVLLQHTQAPKKMNLDSWVNKKLKIKIHFKAISSKNNNAIWWGLTRQMS
jgi:hypothetical protein